MNLSIHKSHLTFPLEVLIYIHSKSLRALIPKGSVNSGLHCYDFGETSREELKMGNICFASWNQVFLIPEIGKTARELIISWKIINHGGNN